MGCDIHMWAEIKKIHANKDYPPTWETVGAMFKSEYHRKGETPTVDVDGFTWNELLTQEPYSGRNYDLFAILADVRNGVGFAGCDTGDSVEPMDNPRGIPSDASEFYKKQSEKWGIDGHSHSFFTLDELLAHDWDKFKVKRGVVGLEEYKVFKKNGKPESWSGGVDGYSVKMVSNEEMDEFIAGTKTVEQDKHYYTTIEWTITHREMVGSFYTKTLPALQKLAKHKDVAGVRIVFFFDN